MCRQGLSMELAFRSSTQQSPEGPPLVELTSRPAGAPISRREIGGLVLLGQCANLTHDRSHQAMCIVFHHRGVFSSSAHRSHLRGRLLMGLDQSLKRTCIGMVGGFEGIARMVELCRISISFDGIRDKKGSAVGELED